MTAEPAANPARAVRSLVGPDTAITAHIHVRELPEGFFPRLGERFLRVYHRTFIDSPSAVALVAQSDGQIQGFLVGVLDPGAHGAHVLRRWGPRLAAAAALAMLTRPRLLAEFLRTRLGRYARGLWRRRRSGVTGGASVVPGSWAVLSHVAVAASCRGSGVGAALVERMHQDVVAARAAGVVLLTAADGPGPGFYARLGYDDEGDVVGADGQTWRRFRWRVA